eukprot:gene1392-2678_t
MTNNFIVVSFISTLIGFKDLTLPRLSISSIRSASPLDKYSEEITFVRNNLNFIPTFLNTNGDDLSIDYVDSGITNYCYKLYDKTMPTNAIFLKHAKDHVKGFNETELSSDRLRYEYEGMMAYSKFFPAAVPKPFLFDPSGQFLVFEWLEDYISLTDSFVKGDLDSDLPRAMGTLMGRSHARTHRMLVPDKVERYKSAFKNKEHFQMWSKKMWEPTIQLLDNNINTEKRKENRLYDNMDNFLMALNEDNHLMIDFEKCAFGPAGLDLGISAFLVQTGSTGVEAWRRDGNNFMAVQTQTQTQTSWSSAQKGNRASTASSTTASSTASATTADGAVDWSIVLEQILRDAAGFMGVYPLFLRIAMPEVNIMSLEGVPGMDFGDKEGWADSVARRQLYLVSECLELFSKPSPITIDDLCSVLLTDDKRLLTEHKTEFWF